MKPVSLALALVASLAFASLGAPARARAEDQPYISVGTARTKKTVIAIPEIRGSARDASKKLTETLTADLTFMDLFRFLEKSAFIEKESGSGIAPGSFKITDWSSIGAEFVLKAAASSEDGAIGLEAYLYDAQSGKPVLAKRYRAAKDEAEVLGHTLANDVVTALTGLPGIFLTKIAMTCEQKVKGKRDPVKEIYVMNFDGTKVKQVTHHGSIAFAPAWSPDGTRIAYSLYSRRNDNVKNIDLYELDFRSSTTRMLSNRKGINSGAAYHPDGRRLAVTMSFLGNPEIFLFDPADKTATRLTKSFGFDVDPAWSPDGKEIAFVSSRSGMPMVFKMKAEPNAEATRLTFAGRYNATPSWSPAGKKMAFAGWIDGIFDIFIMNPDGTNIERLTKGQGNNEDPHFSPDGNFIAFSSNRTGSKQVYVMNVDGTFVKRLSYGLGDCVSPKWSNPPR